jgi:hypothetical protein
VPDPAPANPPTPPTPPPPGNEPPTPDIREIQAQLERQGKELEKARQEAAKYRTRNDDETGSLRKALAGWLGSEGEKTPDPNQVLEQLQARDKAREAEVNRLRVTTALERTARTHGADVDLLEPYLRGTGRLDQLDAADPKFSDALDGLVAELVEKQPKFKANGNGGQVPPRGGSEFPGGNPGPRLLTREDLHGMTDEEINKARKEGRIAGVGGVR